MLEHVPAEVHCRFGGVHNAAEVGELGDVRQGQDVVKVGQQNHIHLRHVESTQLEAQTTPISGDVLSRDQLVGGLAQVEGVSGRRNRDKRDPSTEWEGLVFHSGNDNDFTSDSKRPPKFTAMRGLK